ncbi:MAG: efflux RND transporter periplasmic adaptor subunit [Myxococcota bacterium]
MNPNALALARRAWPIATAALLSFALGWCWAPAERRPGDVESSHSASHDHGRADDQTVWTCSMHPQVRRSGPGDCPVCGMDLVPVSVSDESTLDGEVRPTSATLTLDSRARRLAQIETAVVGQRRSAGRRRLLGRLELDETRLRSVTAWVGGRIERLLVAATGERVRRGQTVAVLYSPEIYAAQRDLRIAVQQLHALGQAEQSAKAAARSAVEASRRRLALLGVPSETIEGMASSEEPATQVAIRSPVAGTVLERLVTEGQYVKAGDPLYRVADLSRLWVQLDAHESEVGQMSLGAEVELRVPAAPKLELAGTVQFVDPTVDSVTRVAQVRIEVRNEGQKLRPGMYVEASVRADDFDDSPLTVPESAVIFTGRRSLVYVEGPYTERPTYVARRVELGAQLDDGYVVESGLEAGERVVVEGAFVLDADLQIRGGPSAMSRDSNPDPHWSRLVETYVQTQEQLAADALDAAQHSARRARTASRALDDPVALRLEAVLDRLVGAADLEEARRAFEEASSLLLEMLKNRSNPLKVPIRITSCPMVGGDRGASWLQTGQEINNPYFGAQMRTCGEVGETLQPGERR